MEGTLASSPGFFMMTVIERSWMGVQSRGGLRYQMMTGMPGIGGLMSAQQEQLVTVHHQVRRAGQQAFVPLKSVLPQLNREAEGRAAPPAGTARRTGAAEINGRGSREDAPVRRAVSHLEGRPREQRPGRGAGYQGQHPADALLSAEESAARAHDASAALETEGYTHRDARGGRGVRQGFEPAGRGGRRDDQGFRGERGRGGGRGDGYGRGGRGQGGARAVAVGDTAEARLPFNYKIAQKLFSAEAELATDEPMWRYIDPSGTVQGPFPARNMLEWYRKGMLHDMGLQVCGAERKVAPPDVPLPIHYYKLGDLLESVKRGQRFVAISVPDIRSGTARPLLHTKAPAQASSGAKKADASKPGKRKERSASRPAKPALETVSLKLVPVESGDGFTVELTVVPPAPKPQEAPAASAPAAEPTAKESSDGALPAAGEAAVPVVPAATAALPDTLLPEIEDSAAESAGNAEAAAEDDAAEETTAATAAAPKAVPEAVSKAAPSDTPAPTGAAAEEEAEAPKDDSAPETPGEPGETALEAPADAPADAAVQEAAPAEAADEETAVPEAEAEPEEADLVKETPAAAAAAEPLKDAGAEPGVEESAPAEETKVEAVQAVLASNVDAVVAADTDTADSITEAIPDAAQPKAEDAAKTVDALQPTEEGSSIPEPAAETAPAKDCPAPQEAAPSTPAEEVNGGSGNAHAAEAAKPAGDEEAEVKEVPLVEAKEAPSEAQDAGQSKDGEEAAGAREGTAKGEAVEAAAEKPKQSSMFKSALKMFQGGK
ncbi:hypothetical protein COCSUDRAFT_66632 [Coccomyxa subellipsoidea C-169]|uniref:GYF domain-containing protein n=1 Tax=Coccomyxa subellipsoidea (strain C-169) TaxID=574566 RepID=I0YVM5_COCSC|nr:hypothetical protein COCSUDRAFT_66632 [Coccomyxa subellipsoidea C-169]EIE22444.1 hypothetical protein COCSUDRAFT_66632 [Coccomyxa subellipsoidea C-169]|eukprot:XP_005646988.1 hypothetical protein COCSUDRAFT_66632 [Coccomyxa subellipsoidea C-169]